MAITSDTYYNFIRNSTDAAKQMTQFVELDFTSDIELYQVDQGSTNCLTVASTNQ